MATLIPFLLLICCVSAAELQAESDNDILPHLRPTEPQEEDPANIQDQQQIDTPDVATVLREMTAHLTELRVEMRHVRLESAAQAAKLRELEVQSAEVDTLKHQSQAQAAKLREMEQSQRDFAQAGDLQIITSRMNITEKQVDTLRSEGEVRRVAFSASLLASGYGNVGPFNTLMTLVFRNVVTNIGNAYNPHTGIFIAPVRGVYHFEFHIYGYGHATHPSGAVLVKNAERIFIAYHHQPTGAGTSSNGVSLLLEVGDVVFLQLQPNIWIHDNQNHHSTFSGHLLFLM